VKESEVNPDSENPDNEIYGLVDCDYTFS
jgi:hypothetical protein